MDIPVDGVGRRCKSPPSYLELLIHARGVGVEADHALEDLLTALCEPVRRFALARLRRCVDAVDIAEDLVQETLIRLARSVRSCRAETDAEVLGWARTAARHALIDMYRSPSTGLAAREMAQLFLEEITSQDCEPSSVSSSDVQALLRVVMEAYNDAVIATGELIWWRLIMGLEWTEIGPKFSTTAAGAKRRFQRAQDTLRREVMRRIGTLPETERTRVLALLTRFGYAQADIEVPPSSVVASVSPSLPLPSCSRPGAPPSHGGGMHPEPSCPGGAAA